MLAVNDEVMDDGRGFTNQFMQQDLGNGSGSGITTVGEQYLQKLKAMGVTVYDSSDPDVRAWMVQNNARGDTWFNGLPGDAGPDTTTVLLGPNANNATIYEEYLHVQYGAARGWVGLDEEQAWIEEIQVKTQVLADADALGMTQAERAELQQAIDVYRQQLWDKYHVTVP